MNDDKLLELAIALELLQAYKMASTGQYPMLADAITEMIRVYRETVDVSNVQH